MGIPGAEEMEGTSSRKKIPLLMQQWVNLRDPEIDASAVEDEPTQEAPKAQMPKGRI